MPQRMPVLSEHDGGEALHEAIDDWNNCVPRRAQANSLRICILRKQARRMSTSATSSPEIVASRYSRSPLAPKLVNFEANDLVGILSDEPLRLAQADGSQGRARSCHSVAEGRLSGASNPPKAEPRSPRKGQRPNTRVVLEFVQPAITLRHLGGKDTAAGGDPIERPGLTPLRRSRALRLRAGAPV